MPTTRAAIRWRCRLPPRPARHLPVPPDGDPPAPRRCAVQLAGLVAGSGLAPRARLAPYPHVDGDIPPALSPLDAFAAQGRLLAKQLDDSNRDGRRVSRLPPLTIASSLAQARPGFSRSGSAEAPALAPRRPG